ncbi:f-actin-capping protein subunit beta, partial [Kipferlia bialata]|eukprot:g3789.t1
MDMDPSTPSAGLNPETESPAESSVQSPETPVDMGKAYAAAIDLLRRVPTAKVSHALALINRLAPELTEDLMAEVDQPLKVLTDTQVDKPFIGCDMNRDGDSYRSPYTSQFYPPLPEDYEAEPVLPFCRAIEEEGNHK